MASERSPRSRPLTWSAPLRHASAHEVCGGGGRENNGVLQADLFELWHQLLRSGSEASRVVNVSKACLGGPRALPRDGSARRSLGTYKRPPVLYLHRQPALRPACGLTKARLTELTCVLPAATRSCYTTTSRIRLTSAVGRVSPPFFQERSAQPAARASRSQGVECGMCWPSKATRGATPIRITLNNTCTILLNPVFFGFFRRPRAGNREVRCGASKLAIAARAARARPWTTRANTQQARLTVMPQWPARTGASQPCRKASCRPKHAG